METRSALYKTLSETKRSSARVIDALVQHFPGRAPVVPAASAPGQPDDTASDVKLSAAVALLAADLGIARQNAVQLEHLEKAVTP